MSDKRDRDRRPRRGRSDEPDFPPEYLAKLPAVPIAPGAVLNPTVTRFDATRGFGFVALSDGLPEAFLTSVRSLTPGANPSRPATGFS